MLTARLSIEVHVPRYSRASLGAIFAIVAERDDPRNFIARRVVQLMRREDDAAALRREVSDGVGPYCTARVRVDRTQHII